MDTITVHFTEKEALVAWNILRRELNQCDPRIRGDLRSAIYAIDDAFDAKKEGGR